MTQLEITKPVADYIRAYNTNNFKMTIWGNGSIDLRCSIVWTCEDVYFLQSLENKFNQVCDVSTHCGGQKVVVIMTPEQVELNEIEITEGL